MITVKNGGRHFVSSAAIFRKIFKPFGNFLVKLHVLLCFRHPKFLIGFKILLELLPVVTVPEFAVTEYRGLFLIKTISGLTQISFTFLRQRSPLDQSSLISITLILDPVRFGTLDIYKIL